MNHPPTWQKEFDAKFFEGERQSIHCRQHNAYASLMEIKSFIAAQIDKAKADERARILAALPKETNEHGDDEADYITRHSRNATLDEVRAIIKGK